MRIAPLLLALSPLLAFAQEPAPPAAAVPGPAEVLARAVSLQRAGDVPGAVAAYEEALRLGADGPVLRSNLGAAHASLGRYDQAIEQYRAALGFDARNAAIRRNLALALYKAGRTAEAAAEVEAVLQVEPANAPAALLLADCRFRLGQNAAAIEILRPLSTRGPHERAASYLLGMAYLAEGRANEAQASIDRVLKDDSPEGRVMLAAMYAASGECPKVLVETKAALERNPKVPLANHLRGRCLMAEESSDWTGAMEAFRAELAVDPNHFESNLMLGSLLREGGRSEEALPFLDRALRLRPDSIAASFALGAAYVALERTAEALPLLEKAASAAPEHLQTHMQLAIVYHRLGRAEDAARERTLVGRLQSEGESRFFEGVSESLSQLLGKKEPPAGKTQPDPGKP